MLVSNFIKNSELYNTFAAMYGRQANSGNTRRGWENYS